MGRPWDWHPLADSDPVPGDPDEVARLSRRYLDTADEIEKQAAVLRKLGSTDWDSDAGGVFAAKAGECADKLSQVHGRYEAAGNALSLWAGPLANAQDTSLRLLANAQDAERRQMANARAGVAPRLADPSTLTPSQLAAQEDAQAAYQVEERRRQAAYDEATADLHAARAAMADEVSSLRSTAKGYADQIQQVIHHDGLKDSFWDRCKAWVDDHAGWIEWVSKIAGWVATALAVAALFIPGVDVIVIAVAIGAAMTVGLAADTTLAAAGDGSWVSVGMDVVGIATLGAGTAATTAAKEAGEEMVETAGKTAAKQAEDKALNAESDAVKARRAKLERRAAKRPAKKRARASQQRAVKSLKEMNAPSREAAANEEARTVAQLDKPTTWVERVKAGDAELAKAKKSAAALRDSKDAALTCAPEVQAAYGRAGAAMSRAQPLVYGTWAVDAAKNANEIVELTGLRKEGVIPDYRQEVGSSW